MSESLTYLDSGVNIDAGNELVDRIKKIVPLTHRPGVMGGIGGFGGCFDISAFANYKHPVLVSSTDGVGTKLRLAIQCQQHDTIGIDLVAMCVNDLIVMGAEPLFFLDYFATGELNVDVAESVIQGIAKGCQQAHVALIGGETAEMPGMYQKEDYDLAGFTVGIVEKNEVIDGREIEPGDLLLALPSSGPHSNGYSLIRHILNTKNIALDTLVDDRPLSQHLLAPTRIYVRPVLALARAYYLKGAAHITGGGFIDNIPRILPKDCAAKIDIASWQMPSIFSFLQAQGQLSNYELRRTFNCGVGMVLCVAKSMLNQAMTILKAQGETPWVIGEIIPRSETGNEVVFTDE